MMIRSLPAHAVVPSVALPLAKYVLCFLDPGISEFLYPA